MPSLADEIAADLAEAIGLYEQTFEWQGETYPCARTTAPTESMSGLGGDQSLVSERITVALSAFPDGVLPTYGDFVDQGALQVDKVDPNVGHLVLWLVDPMYFKEATD